MTEKPDTLHQGPCPPDGPSPALDPYAVKMIEIVAISFVWQSDELEIIQ
jgi:hypothetical protein